MNVLNLLLALFPLSGEQVYDLSSTVIQETQLSSYYCSHAFKSPAQKNNYYIIATTLDWDIPQVLKTRGVTADDCNRLVTELNTLPPSNLRKKLYVFIEESWNTNWVAGDELTNAVKRLYLDDQTTCQKLAAKLNISPQTNSDFYFTSHYKADSVYPMVLWPEEHGLYSYQHKSGIWVPTAVSYKLNPTTVKATWGRPTGTTYHRSWVKGNEWQITYSFSHGMLTRQATYVKKPCSVFGEITGNSFKESIEYD